MGMHHEMVLKLIAIVEQLQLLLIETDDVDRYLGSAVSPSKILMWSASFFRHSWMLLSRRVRCYFLSRKYVSNQNEDRVVVVGDVVIGVVVLVVKDHRNRIGNN